jgi:hypothetical protein
MDKDDEGNVPELKKLKSSDSKEDSSEKEQIDFKTTKQQVKKEPTPTKAEQLKDDGNASDSSDKTEEEEIIIFEKNKTIKTEAPVEKKDGEPHQSVPQDDE